MVVAIPRITDDFHVLNDVCWYASSYLLTTCCKYWYRPIRLTLSITTSYISNIVRKVLYVIQVKWVYLTALFLFELGSLICGVAPNPTTLIVGRAVAGLESAGMFTGALVTLIHRIVLEKRPIFFSMLGGMYGIASVIGKFSAR